MISVIVPVYNVESYLDECILSIVQQTYRDLEILLINDGSTDRSGDICADWAKKDKRIRFIDKANEGQARSRNLGVRKAKGEYVIFVDSDDFIYEDMIELLFDAIVKEDADIAICDADVELPGGKVSDFSLQNLKKENVVIKDDPAFIVSVRYTMWGKLYKKSFLLINGIEQPDMKFEDFAVVPITLALAEKVACVDKRLYFYRYRETSTVRDIDYIHDRFRSIEYLISSFKERGIFEAWENVLQEILTKRAVVLMRQIYPLLHKYYKTCYERFDQILTENFQLSLSGMSSRYPAYRRTGKMDAHLFGAYNLCVIGSYNLMIVAKMMMQIGTPDYLENHYGFSNIISMMSEIGGDVCSIDLSHKSSYRQKHLIQDFTKRFKYKNRCEFNDIDYVLIDFLEERFDTGRAGELCFTVSDAFLEINRQIHMPYEIINESEAWTLWTKACDKLIRLLEEYVGTECVVLVKNYLSEYILEKEGTLTRFENAQEIKRINEILKKKYQYFTEHAKGVLVWETEKDDYYYTEKQFKHGCYPWHLNNKEYCKIAGDLMGFLRGEREMDETCSLN